MLAFSSSEKAVISLYDITAILEERVLCDLSTPKWCGSEGMQKQMDPLGAERTADKSSPKSLLQGSIVAVFLHPIRLKVVIDILQLAEPTLHGAMLH